MEESAQRIYTGIRTDSIFQDFHIFLTVTQATRKLPKAGPVQHPQMHGRDLQ